MPPYTPKKRIPYKDSAAGHRKLGSMIWVAESLGNYRWAVQLGLALCEEYNRGRGRAAGKVTKHKTQKVLEWLRDHEPKFKIQKRMPVKHIHLAMPDRFKKAANSVEAYHLYYYSKRRTMAMQWPAGRTPPWWLARQSPKKYKEFMDAKRKKAIARKKQLAKEKTVSKPPKSAKRTAEATTSDDRIVARKLSSEEMVQPASSPSVPQGVGMTSVATCAEMPLETPEAVAPRQDGPTGAEAA